MNEPEFRLANQDIVGVEFWWIQPEFWFVHTVNMQDIWLVQLKFQHS